MPGAGAELVLEEEFIGTDEQATEASSRTRGARRLIIVISPYFSAIDPSCRRTALRAPRVAARSVVGGRCAGPLFRPTAVKFFDELIRNRFVVVSSRRPCLR